MAVISTLGAVFSIVETGFSISRSRLCDTGSYRRCAGCGHGSATVGRYEADIETSIPRVLSLRPPCIFPTIPSSPFFPPLLSGALYIIRCTSPVVPFRLDICQEPRIFLNFFCKTFGLCQKTPYLCIRFRERNTSRGTEERVL